MFARIVKTIGYAIYCVGAACICALLAYVAWPDDFFSTPFATLTLGMLFRAFGGFIAALVALGFLGRLGRLADGPPFFND